MGDNLIATTRSLRPDSLSPARNRLSTASVPAHERFAYYLDIICAVYTKLDCERPANGDVFGEIVFSRLGSLDLTQIASNVHHVRRAPASIRSDTRDSLLVHIQRQGRGIVQQDSRQAHLLPGDFAIYDTTRPYDLHFQDPHHDVIVVRLPRSQLEPHVVNLHELTATTVPGSGAAGHLLLTMIETLQRDIDRLHPSSAAGVAEGVTSIIAAGLRSLARANTRRPSNLSAYHVARVKAYVTQCLRDPELSIANIAAAVKLSPDHLSRLFRAEPVALSRLIWQQRLDACRRELSDPRQARRSVSEIAFSWGFNDATHFSRSFKEQFAMTPREWRLQTEERLSRREPVSPPPRERALRSG